MSDCRAKGYHYVMGKDLKKHRVYPKSSKSMPMSMSGSGAYRYRRPATNLKGRGGYYDSSFVKTMKSIVPRGAFSTLGSALAGPLGSVGGNVLAKIAGFGSYTVKKNSLIDEGQSPARMHSSTANTRIRHREYITDIVSSSSANTFLLQNYNINPGLASTFPWLSAIAQQYQEWVPLGIVFEFKTLSADAIASSTNNTLGGIIMSTNYNSASSNFSNKQSMDNTEYTTSDKPSNSFYHAIECAPHANVLPELYIRSLAVPSGQDQKTYDLGNFQIASFGIQGTSVVLGELWVSYDIELRKPISTAAAGLDVLTDHYRTGSVTNSAPLGTTSALQAGSSLGTTITTTGTVLNFPNYLQEGSYIVYVVWKGSSTASLAVPSLTPTNCTISNYFTNGTVSQVAVPNTATYTALTFTFVVNLTGLTASVAFGTGGTLPSSVSSGDIVITQLNSGTQ